MNRPVLFQNFPEKIICPVNRFSDLLETEAGKNVSVSFMNDQDLQGTITSVVSKYDNRLQSVVIKLTNFPGATLTFSRIINEHGIYSYAGRILSFQHGDAYEITLENGQYYFIKKGFYDLVNE